jgi:hypothetical protein
MALWKHSLYFLSTTCVTLLQIMAAWCFFLEPFPAAVLHTVNYCRLLFVRGVLRCAYLTGVRSLFDLNAKLMLDMGQDGLTSFM